MVDKKAWAKEMVDILAFMDHKQNVTTDEVVSEFGFTATTAKRYMR